MNAARAREQYQEALSLLSELQAEDSEQKNAFQSLFQLVRTIHSIQRASQTVADKESKFIWNERLENLQDALVPVVAQLLRPSQAGDDFWRKCISMLYTGVETCEQLEHANQDLRVQLAAEKARNEQLKLEFESQVNAKAAAVKETFELRTRLHIQQQDLFQTDSQSRDFAQHLQALTKEKDDLCAEKARLDEECSVKTGVLERQSKAIAQLMDQCESECKEREKALQALKSLSDENRTLDVNLNQHTKVIENLIHINADLMDRANSYKHKLSANQV